MKFQADCVLKKLRAYQCVELVTDVKIELEYIKPDEELVIDFNIERMPHSLSITLESGKFIVREMALLCFLARRNCYSNAFDARRFLAEVKQDCKIA